MNPSHDHHNVWSALRAAFPTDLDRWAVETDTGLVYCWRDLDRASAMVANLLASLDLPEGARVAVQVENPSRPWCFTWPRCGPGWCSCR